MDLVDAILGHPDDPERVRLTYGVVTGTAPLTATIGAATTAVTVARLTSYTPTIGDFVAVLVRGADRIVLGETTT